MMVCCSGLFTAFWNHEYSLLPPGPPWTSTPVVAEVMPLPPNVQLRRHECGNLGAHRACVNVFLMAATDRASRDELISRLAEHYTRLGWPLQPVGAPQAGIVQGCRPVVRRPPVVS